MFIGAHVLKFEAEGRDSLPDSDRKPTGIWV